MVCPKHNPVAFAEPPKSSPIASPLKTEGNTHSALYQPYSGATAAFVNLLVIAVGMFFLVTEPLGPLGFMLLLLGTAMIWGYFSVNPAEAKLVFLQGVYKGVVSQEGFYWVNPLSKMTTLSLKPKTYSRNDFNATDRFGMPLILSFSLTWRVTDPNLAYFAHQELDKAVSEKFESIITHLSSVYPYQDNLLGQVDFKDGLVTIAQLLEKEAIDALRKLGVRPLECKLYKATPNPSVTMSLSPLQTAHKATEIARQVIQKIRNDGFIPFGAEDEKRLYSDIIIAICSQS